MQFIAIELINRVLYPSSGDGYLDEGLTLFQSHADLDNHIVPEHGLQFASGCFRGQIRDAKLVPQYAPDSQAARDEGNCGPLLTVQTDLHHLIVDEGAIERLNGLHRIL